ncbi:uncharacterized protein TrAFT101_007427 [Trichoderma asperellum]|uniref:uncharacterized protein n=1 Tax=Trichoderma asperellum TaxID=101201 RepID=UPI00332E4279|nr:hypothetical protein TrAFT101_007427 [Trichoderma asperellum]
MGAGDDERPARVDWFFVSLNQSRPAAAPYPDTASGGFSPLGLFHSESGVSHNCRLQSHKAASFSNQWAANDIRMLKSTRRRGNREERKGQTAVSESGVSGRLLFIAWKSWIGYQSDSKTDRQQQRTGTRWLRDQGSRQRHTKRLR